jgi:uncharacterized protein (UPF0212 family)
VYTSYPVILHNAVRLTVLVLSLLTVNGTVIITIVDAVVGADRPEHARKYAEKMLGQRLITKQSGAEGLPCNKVCAVLAAYN